MPQDIIQVAASAAQKASHTAVAGIAEPIQAAAQGAIQTTVLEPGAVAHTSLSMLDMFLKADFVVMSIMILLIATSIWSWTVIINKTRHLRHLNRQGNLFEETFWAGGSLDQLYDRIGSRPTDPLSSVFSAAMQEWRRSVTRGASVELKTGLRERIERIMQVTIGRDMESIERHMSLLASVGSTAPFVGLLGTVWGIMNSFHAIAASQNTSLAVVAPGIAEALFVTALGLLTAIPAYVAYNKISNDITRYENRLETFCSEFGSIISRQLEEGA